MKPGNYAADFYVTSVQARHFGEFVAATESHIPSGLRYRMLYV